MVIYLCGAINGCSDSEAKDWREYVKAHYPEYDYLDPMVRDFRGRENEPGIDAEIVEGDIEDIHNSDIILVNYDKPSVGTSMEVYLAHDTGKIVILVAKPDAKLSPWLTYHSDIIVPSFAEAMSKVRAIDERIAYQKNYQSDLEAAMESANAKIEAMWAEIGIRARA